MQLHVAVTEGDYAASPWGDRLARRISDADWCAASQDRVARWCRLQEEMAREQVVLEVTAGTTIGQLRQHALAVARERGLTRPAPDSKATANQWPAKLLGSSLHDPVTGRTYRDEHRVGECGLADGDLVELHIRWDFSRLYLLLPSPDPDHLFKNLLLGAAAAAPDRAPRLWGALLYTDADAALATYVRTHFDELNALTGPLLRIFVIERPASWSSARRYWRAHLEPPLLRVLASMRWLCWQPFDRHRCHDIARALGIPAHALPCLVLFRGTDQHRRLVFPIESASPAYLRALFGAIQAAAGAEPEGFDLQEERQRVRWVPLVTDEAAERAVQEAIDGLPRSASPAAASTADQAAFDRVLAAEQRILAAVRPQPDPAPAGPERSVLAGHTVFVLSAGSAMTENFHFHGPTTFINRPATSTPSGQPRSTSSGNCCGWCSPAPHCPRRTETGLPGRSTRRRKSWSREISRARACAPSWPWYGSLSVTPPTSSALHPRSSRA